ncbi:MAG: ATP-binding cassette domain-containing protein [Aestuariivita sp.]|nr:ATP-binding cassette domain-containing protein [Aestuariivita sp.]
MTQEYEPVMLSMSERIDKIGRVIPCAGNAPLALDASGQAWYIESGAVDIFLVECIDGVEQTAPKHLVRTQAAHLVPSVKPHEAETTLKLIAKGLPHSVVKQVSLSELARLAPVQTEGLIDDWILDLTRAFSKDFFDQPLPDLRIQINAEADLVGRTVSTRGGVVWLDIHTESPDQGLFMGVVDTAEYKVGSGEIANPLPLTPDSWLEFSSSRPIPDTSSSAQLIKSNRLLPALEAFHDLVLSTERLNRMFAIADQTNVERESSFTRLSDENEARDRLLGVPTSRSDDDACGLQSPLKRALNEIGNYEGINFQWPQNRQDPSREPDLSSILKLSGVRKRSVWLSGIERWWVGDSGAMLGYSLKDNTPLALIPSGSGRYRSMHPKTGEKTVIDEEQNKTVGDLAYQFYRPFSQAVDGSAELGEMARPNLSAPLVKFLLMGLISNFLFILPVVALWLIAAFILPSGENDLLKPLIFGFLLYSLFAVFAYVLQGMAMMQIEARFTTRVEAAFWDRLLKLPIDFLRQYSSADRAMRGLAFQRLRDNTQWVASENVISVIFALLMLSVLLVLDVTLGLVVLIVGGLALTLTIMLGLRQIRPYDRSVRISNRIVGSLFQIINGIGKLRVEGAEGSAYAVWARDYKAQKRAELDLGMWEAHLKAFGTALPLIGAAALMGGIAVFHRDNVSTGDFILIFFTFLLFLSSVTRLGNEFGAIMIVKPELDRIAPFLSAKTEEYVGHEPVEQLNGKISFDRVSFRYSPDGPLILDNVSLQANSGEMIAIAGHSGAGKSTLFRLLLGLNLPTSGTILFDGRDLRQLNVRQLREKIGAVPQHSSLSPESIWDNISAGHDDISARDIWRAAQVADIDGAITRMPMQMLTCVGNHQNVLSGGELQRITIARAVSRSPRILLLDEATSALDNKSQARVMENLAKLPMTQVVIAQRLSTLKQADRIYVLQKGRIAEAGTYDELVGSDGVFCDLVRRQEL